MTPGRDLRRRCPRTLVEALNVDEDQVTPTATLQGDLGAESIDFLDIVFRLEREFGIKIPRERAVPRVDLPGRPGVRPGRQGDRQGPGRAARARCPTPT